MIEFNLHIVIQGESGLEVAQEMARLGSAMSSGLGVGPQHTTPENEHPMKAEPASPVDAAPEASPVDAAPATRRRKGAKAEPEPAPETKAPAPNGAEHRAEIIEGLTKIYSKGDAETRSRITEFRDKHGADRLRDLKDDDLPAAAQLLIALKVNEAADAV